jgi:RecA/RadA recombinase
MNITDKLIEKFDNTKVFKFEKLDPFSEESSWIPTYSPSLDLRLKTLGLPGGIIEVRGDSQAGKTTFSLMSMRGCLETYGERAVVIVLSSERRDNKPYAEKLGVDVSKVLIIRIKTIEDVFNKTKQTVDMVKKMIADGEIKMEGKPKFFFTWDSLGNTVSRQEKETMEIRSKVVEVKTKEDEKNETKSAAMASAARAISLGFRSIIALSDDIDITFLFINRSYENIEGHGKTSAGGTAVTYYPCMRIELSRKEGIKFTQDGEEMGQITLVNAFKTDFSRPKQKFAIEIGYGYGFVLTEDDLQIGFDAGILEKYGNGAKFMKGKLQWKSRRELYKLYEENNPFIKVLTKKLIKLAHAKVLEERQAQS